MTQKAGHLLYRSFNGATSTGDPDFVLKPDDGKMTGQTPSEDSHGQYVDTT